MKQNRRIVLKKAFFFVFFLSSCTSTKTLLDKAKDSIRTERSAFTKKLLESKQKLQASIKKTREREGVSSTGHFYFNPSKHLEIKSAWEEYKKQLKSFQSMKPVLLASLALEKEAFAPSAEKTIRYEHKDVTFFITKKLLTSGVFFSDELDAATAEVVGTYRFHPKKDLTLFWFVRWDAEAPWRPLEIDKEKKTVEHEPLKKDKAKGMIELLEKREKEEITTPKNFTKEFFEIYKILYTTLYFRSDESFSFLSTPHGIKGLPE